MSKLFLSLALIGLIGCTRHRNEASEHVILKVNDHEITAKVFAESLARHLRLYDALTVKDQKHLEQIKDQILKDFIIQAISEDYARTEGLLVKKEDLDSEINSIRSNYPDDESFRKSLAEQNINFNEWSEKIRMTLLNRLIVQHLAKTSEPTSEEIAAVYKASKADYLIPEQIRLRQVVLSSENDAEAVLEEIKKGRTLKELAPKFSLTPEGKKGGDTGWIDRGTLEIFDQGFKMDKGQRSPILKSDFGYHIFEVLDKRRSQAMPLEEVKLRIKRQLVEKREQALYAQWLESQVRKAHVFRDEVFIGRIKAETKSEE